MSTPRAADMEAAPACCGVCGVAATHAWALRVQGALVATGPLCRWHARAVERRRWGLSVQQMVRVWSRDDGD